MKPEKPEECEWINKQARDTTACTQRFQRRRKQEAVHGGELGELLFQ